MVRDTFSWILLIAAFIIFFIAACITDLVIKALNRLGNSRASRRGFLALNQFTELLLKLWGTRIDFDASALTLDPERPVLFVSSHHSSLDVCLLGTRLSHYIGDRNLGFVCRSGLDRWLPSYSFYARQYCYSLTRKGELSASSSPEKSIEKALPEYARRIEAQGDALVFFPEGVKPLHEAEHSRPFRRKGLRILLGNIPNAQIVPIGIAGTRSFFTTPRCFKSMLQHRPRFNCQLQFQVMPVMQASQFNDIESMIDSLEEQVSASYDYLSTRAQVRRSPLQLTQKWTR